MARIITLEELPKDELLQDLVTNEDIAATHEFIEDFSWSKGVDPIEISNTHVPYKLKQLAINYTYMTVANNKSIMNNKAQDGADAYDLKRKVYAAEVERLKNEITAPVLLGHSPRQSLIPTIQVFRA